MKYIKFSPSTLSPTQMIAQSQATETGFTDNSSVLTTPPVTPAQLATQRGVVDTAQQTLVAIQSQLQTQAATLAQQNGILGAMLAQDASYNDQICIANPNNAEAISHMGGFAGKNAPVHHLDKPAAVQHLSVTLGDLSGSADIHFDALHGYAVQLYKIYYNSQTPNAPFNAQDSNWQLGNSVAISSATLAALPIHQPIAFCVVAVNTNGDGTPSAIVLKTLL